MLSRVDETDLLIPLHEGVLEAPPWATFLARLCRRARADGAALLVQTEPPYDRPTLHSFARAAPQTWPDLATLQRLRPGRVYGEDEMDGPSPLRVVRVPESQSRATGWVMLQRSRGDFGAIESALLSGLAPHVATALRTFASLQCLEGRDAAAQSALDRIGVGWLAIGPDGRITDIDPLAAGVLRASFGLVDCIGERLPLANAGAKALATALATFANAADDTPHVITLSEQPFLPMLAIAAPQAAGAGLLGFLRVARKGNARAPVFAALTGLPPSEARLAIAMTQQPSLADAAASLGITIETARNYSKRIYAQTNTRGQPDLVRLILNGLTPLA